MNILLDLEYADKVEVRDYFKKGKKSRFFNN